MRTQSTQRCICLLGGSGFIGRHAAARLVARGHDVIVLTRSPHRHRDLLVLPTLRLMRGNPLDAASLTRALAGVDAVVNLVGIVNEQRRGGSFRRVHVEVTEQALAACRESGVPRFVQLSALKARADGPSRYLKTKGEAEARIRDSGLAWTILQPSVVFGPEDEFVNRFARLLRTLPVMPLPRANTRLAPVFVGDVAEAIARVLEEPGAAGQTYQLCGPRVVSLREIVSMVGKVTGRPRPLWPLPPSLGRLQGRLMELLPGKPFSVDNFRSLSVHSICESDAPGLGALGVRATPLETGLRRYLAPAGD